MKNFSLIIFTILIVSACSKKDVVDPPKLPGNEFPEMLVTELNDAEVKHQQQQVLDLDKDAVNDLFFATWYIGDPVEQEDEVLFFAASGTQSALMVSAENASPKFSRNDIIPVNPVAGYNWYVVAQVEMAMKNIGFTAPPYWEKDWKDATHKFLAVQVKCADKLYYGWVEVSMDTANSKLILHRSAIAKQPGRAVKVGI
jgi:hypothetical protein